LLFIDLIFVVIVFSGLFCLGFNPGHIQRISLNNMDSGIAVILQ